MPEVPNSKGMRGYALQVCLALLTPLLYLTTNLFPQRQLLIPLSSVSF